MLTAIIHQEACVKCAICVEVCPFDAILGSVGQKHTVLTDLCIGCKLCVNPCPLDCIEMIPLSNVIPVQLINKKQKISNAKKQRIAKLLRLKTQGVAKFATKEAIKKELEAIISNAQVSNIQDADNKQ